MILDKQQDILLKISNEITRIRGKEDMLHIILDNLEKHITFHDGFILRYDKTTRSCKPYIYYAGEGRTNKPEFKKFLDLEYPVLDDSVEGENYPIVYLIEALLPYGGEQIAFMDNAGVKEFAVLKLIEGNQLTGLFILLSEQVHSFKRDDLDLLHRLSYQISIATANIIANEEIAKGEEEKTILLSLSNEIAALRNRCDLFNVVNGKLKDLFLIREFGIAQINVDNRTYGAFILDMSQDVESQSDYNEITAGHYDVDDPVFSSIMRSDEPVLFDVDELAKAPGRPAYVDFWKRAGLREVLCVALRASGSDIGCAFLHPEEGASKNLNVNLLKGVCAQLSVAVSNILANEEIVRREYEKSRLLLFSNSIASVRNKNTLAKKLKDQLFDLFAIRDYAIHVLSDNRKTHYPILYDDTAHFAKHIEYLNLIGIKSSLNEDLFNAMVVGDQAVVFNTAEWFHGPGSNAHVETLQISRQYEMTGVVIQLGDEDIAIMTFRCGEHCQTAIRQPLFKSICSQISVTISNVIANEKIDNQLAEINRYKQQLEQEKIYLKEEIATTQNYADIIGNSSEMQKVFRMVAQVASSTSTVLLLGETGTGKELIARAIHDSSPRKNKLMVKVNCAALPVNLIESELFGHERGSFTGATERRLGKFELANNGTLFLDEIGEMPIELQVKLLRAIQEREIERVGGSNTIKVDVRIIAATNRDLDKMIEEGKFRTDLYYRLNIFPISLPPLRERRDDIPALADYFVNRLSKKAGKPLLSFNKKVFQELMDYSWPGNIRELEHLIERSVLLADGHVINELHIQPGKIKLSPENTQPVTIIRTMDENDKVHILNVLKHCRGKITGSGGAAELLGIPPSTLNSRIKKLGIKREFLS